MLRQRVPEPAALGPGGHVGDEDVVRVGDPESRGAEVRVVGRQDGVVVGRPEHLHGQVAVELVARLIAVLEEEAVAVRPERSHVLDQHAVRAVDRHAAVVGVVDADTGH